MLNGESVMFIFIPRSLIAIVCILADVAIFTLAYIACHFIIKAW